MVDQRHRPPEENFGTPDDTPFTEAIDQLQAYFAGELKEFTLQLRLHGTPFQRSVWDQLRRIPYGETRSYGELADALGNPAPPARSASPTARTPSGSSSPATGSSARTAASRATAAAWTASSNCWTSTG
jgi:methylated-DNA-[protein]-cysteine S-methyltransferase